MNKFTSLFAALVISSVAPMVAQEATSFYGSATQTNGVATQGTINYNLPTTLGTGLSLSNVYSSSFGAGGSQTGYIGFSSSMSSPSNCPVDESGSGSGYTIGNTVVNGSLIQGTNTVGSWTNGSTSGAGSVSLTNSPCGSDSFSLIGYGSLSTGTSALIGNFTTITNANGIGLSPTNGAFASSSTTGGFSFSVSGTSGNGSNGTWSGNGYTIQTGYSQVSNLGNGYSAASSASVTSSACPVVSK
jgi:hypothetical protein